MADRILALARDADLRRGMGAGGWHRAKEHFSWDRERRELDEALRRRYRHPDLTLLVCHRRSLERARNGFRVRSALCPDMNFALGPLARPAPRRSRSSGCPARTVNRPATEGSSWGRRSSVPIGPIMPPACRAGAITCSAGRSSATRGVLGWLSPVAALSFDALAGRLSRGVRLLSRGRVVITDRLHGHILCMLVGMPHVLLDNSYGKLKAFHETWTQGSHLVRWSTSAAEAVGLPPRWPPRPARRAPAFMAPEPSVAGGRPEGTQRWT
jgi:hypothetical protein